MKKVETMLFRVKVLFVKIIKKVLRCLRFASNTVANLEIKTHVSEVLDYFLLVLG